MRPRTHVHDTYPRMHAQKAKAKRYCPFICEDQMGQIKCGNEYENVHSLEFSVLFLHFAPLARRKMEKYHRKVQPLNVDLLWPANNYTYKWKFG